MALEFLSSARADFILVKRVPSPHPGAEGTVRTFASTHGGDYDGGALQYVEAEIQLLVDGLQALSDRRDGLWAARKSQASSVGEPEL